MGKLSILVIVLAVGVVGLLNFSQGSVLSLSTIGQLVPRSSVRTITPITQQGSSGDLLRWLQKNGLVYGTVSLGPTGGPCRVDSSSGCTTPFSTTIQVTTEDGNTEVARFISNKDGLYAVVLPAGSYLFKKPEATLAPNAKPTLPRLTPVKVTVKSGQTVKVSLDFDSGRR